MLNITVSHFLAVNLYDLRHESPRAKVQQETELMLPWHQDSVEQER